MKRHCARPGCSNPAAATFEYHYPSRTVWLNDVAEEPHPSSYDLCLRHAATMSVPRGWQLSDHRSFASSLRAIHQAS
ncbi:MAG: DUF3499 family protein [Actinomycetes bacterium]